MIRLENIGECVSSNRELDRFVVAFVNTHVKTLPGNMVSIRIMHEAYASFLGTSRGKPHNIREFAIMLKRLGKTTRHTRVMGRMTRLWEHVVIVGLDE